MSTSKNVVYTLGPKGGFKRLEFDFIQNGAEVHHIVEDKDEGADYLEAFDKYNIEKKVIQLEKKIPVRKKK